jgi:hypothetical protein
VTEYETKNASLMCGVPVFVSVDNVWLSLGGRLLNLDLCLLPLLFISCQSVTARFNSQA